MTRTARPPPTRRRSAPTAPRAPTAARRSSSARRRRRSRSAASAARTVVRAGDELRKIGESAELFDDHTPLQLGAAGTLPGRALHARRPAAVPLRRRHLERMARALRRAARRAEVGLALGGQRPLRLRLRRAADDAGAAARAACSRARRSPSTARAGRVASVVAAKLIAAAGRAAASGRDLEHGFVVADLRSSRGEVGTLDYSDPARPALVGRPARCALSRASR